MTDARPRPDWSLDLDAALYDTDPVARDGARSRIARRAEPRSVAALVGLLDGAQRMTRRRAARILSEVHPNRARPALRAALDDPDRAPRLRGGAARVLAVLADGIEPSLGPHLIGDPLARVRRACATPATATDALVTALGDSAPTVVERAAAMLEGRISTLDARVRAALRVAVPAAQSAAAESTDAPPGLRPTLARLMAQLDAAAPSLRAAAQRGEATALDHLDGSAAWLELEGARPVASAWGLSRAIPDPAAVEALAAQAKHPDPRVRAAVARGLPPSHPLLAQLGGDRDRGVAWIARRARGGAFTPDTLAARQGPHARSDAPSARPPYGLRPEDALPPVERVPAALAMCHPRFDVNLGVAVRSAEAAGLREVFLVGRAELFRSPARGTDRLLPLRHAPDAAALVRQARTSDYQIVAVQQTPDSVPFHQADYPPRPLFVVGAEDEGVPPALRAAADLVVEIPMWGAIDSLNVAAATTTVLFHWRAVHASADSR